MASIGGAADSIPQVPPGFSWGWRGRGRLHAPGAATVLVAVGGAVEHRHVDAGSFAPGYAGARLGHIPVVGGHTPGCITYPSEDCRKAMPRRGTTRPARPTPREGWPRRRPAGRGRTC